MTRVEKIKDLQSKIETIKVVWQPLNEQLQNYERELRRAERSFEVGENVEYREENCRRGCCGFTRHDCVVMSLTDNGAYNIKSSTGEIFNYVSDSEMSRVL